MNDVDKDGKLILAKKRKVRYVLEAPAAQKIYDHEDWNKAIIKADIFGKYVGELELNSTSGMRGVREVVYFWVEPCCRGEGIGSELISLAIDLARKCGIEKLEVEPRPTGVDTKIASIEETTQNLYEKYKKYGFVLYDQNANTSKAGQRMYMNL